MSADSQNSTLIEIVKRNGEFRKNWGILLGALPYMGSVQAAVKRVTWSKWLIAAGLAVFAAFLRRYLAFV